MKNIKKILFFIAILVISIIAMSITIFSLTTTKKIKNVKIPYNFEFKSKDPQKNADGWTTSITRQIVATLTQVNKKDQLEYANAKDIKISNGGKKLTVSLNSDYKWEDKVAIKAQDYYFGIKHLLDPKTKSEYAYWATNNIVGAKDYYEQNADEIQGIKIINDSTFEINLINKNDQFLQLLSNSVFSPLREDFYKKHVNDYGTRWDSILSSGLYKIESFKNRQYVNLVPNKASKRTTYLKVNNIKFTKIDNKLSEYKLFQQNKLTNYFETKKVGKLEEENQKINNSEMVYLIPNNKVVDKNLALAFYYALDKKYISENLLGGFAKPTAAIYPSAFNNGYHYENANLYDLKKAKQYLSKVSKAKQKLVLLVGNDFNNNVLKYIINQSKELGLVVEIKKSLPRLVNEQVFKQPNTQRDYDFALNTWNANYNDVHAFTSEFINEDINYINKFDDEIANKVNNVDASTNQMFMDNGYLLPLWQTVSKLYYRDNIISQTTNGYFLNAYYWN